MNPKRYLSLLILGIALSVHAETITITVNVPNIEAADAITVLSDSMGYTGKDRNGRLETRQAFLNRKYSERVQAELKHANDQKRLRALQDSPTGQ